MATTVRQEQIRHMLIEEVSDMLRKDLKDPRLGFITVTDAEVSRDLRYAKVYVSVMGSEEEQLAAMKALRRAAGLVRGEFARRAHLRVAPELEFRFDEGIAKGARIFELLKQLEQGESSRGAPDASDAGSGEEDRDTAS
ncbi:MAG: 30S ribosome-binding factor RbfA [Chthonomonadales bacterium]